MNIEIDLGRIKFFTVLSLYIQEQGTSFLSFLPVISLWKN